MKKKDNGWPQYFLNDKEWRELVTLEYVLTWGYENDGDFERYKRLGKKKYGNKY
jgi:hypothetical protein